LAWVAVTLEMEWNLNVYDDDDVDVCLVT